MIGSKFLLQEIELGHRIVLAPLTRCRASEGTYIPADSAIEYYRQRSSEGGLLISEGTLISEQARGTVRTPGIYTKEQVDKWKKITKAVHEKKAYIFMQLWHVGRVSHPDFQPQGNAPVSSSAVHLGGTCMTMNGIKERVTPRALTIPEIQQVITDFKTAAKNAKDAGFDGVEIHGANGYLIQQFLEDQVNLRTDEYGGSIENRGRFLFQIVEACIEAMGADRVGVRLAPFSTFNDIGDSNPIELYNTILTRLNDYKLAYVHLVEPRVFGNTDKPIEMIYNLDEFNKRSQNEPVLLSNMTRFREIIKHPLVIAGGFKPHDSGFVIEKGMADLVAFGRYFISNPDLPSRIVHGYPVEKYNRDTFYTHDDHGYIDYPCYSLK